jgi:hypothetical protein
VNFVGAIFNDYKSYRNFLMEENPGKLYFMNKFYYYQDRFFFLMPQRASVFCNFYIRVDREALVSERALDVGSVAFKAMSTKRTFS